MARRRKQPKVPNRRETKQAARNARILHESPVARLERLSKLNIYELTAADELVAAHAMANGLPVLRYLELGIPSDAAPGAADAAAARRFDLLPKYQQWRRDLANTSAGRVANDVLFAEKTMRQVDGENKWRTTTARKHLLVALRHFAALRGNVPKGIRDWRYVPIVDNNSAS